MFVFRCFYKWWPHKAHWLGCVACMLASSKFIGDPKHPWTCSAFTQLNNNKVCRPKTNAILKPTLCTTCIHLEAPNYNQSLDSLHRKTPSNKRVMEWAILGAARMHAVPSEGITSKMGKPPSKAFAVETWEESVYQRRFVSSIRPECLDESQLRDNVPRV